VSLAVKRVDTNIYVSRDQTGSQNGHFSRYEILSSYTLLKSISSNLFKFDEMKSQEVFALAYGFSLHYSSLLLSLQLFFPIVCTTRT
jgi:hypothetical protein